jgi:OFA family oxalate/formate antiporter-like MFS transporter
MLCIGTRWMGLNYGLILSAWGAAGLVGPIAFAQVRDRTGSSTTVLAGLAVVLSMSMPLP